MSDLTDVLSTSPATGELPPLSPYRDGNAGIPYVLSFAASDPGPHVLLAAIVHGNEICGAIALDRLGRAKLAAEVERLGQASGLAHGGPRLELRNRRAGGKSGENDERERDRRTA